MGREGGRLKAGCGRGSSAATFRLFHSGFQEATAPSEGEGLLWLCLPVRLHTCAHVPNMYLYLPKYTRVHFHSLPPPGTGVTAHPGFAHVLASVPAKWGTSE